MGRRAARNVRVLQAVLAHHLRRGWLLSTMYLPRGGTRGCAAAAPRSVGAGDAPCTSPALVGLRSVGFTLRCSPQFKVFMPPSKRRAVATLGIGKAVPVGEKSPFEPHAGCFIILSLPPAGFIGGGWLWGWMCVHKSRSRAGLARAAFWPPVPRQRP